MPLQNEPDGTRPQPPAITDPPRSGGPKSTMRTQPPSIRNPPQGDSRPWEPGAEADAAPADPAEEDDGEEAANQPNWTKRAKDAYRFSSSYLDTNLRRQWDDALRAFNNEHPGDSKYNSETFRKRSRLFVPVTRTVIRKNEAAACQAFFSNQELVSISAMNEAEKPQLISAEILKQLLQYRLTHSIDWFRVLIGALQDAQKQGACIAEVYWEYETKLGADGKRKVKSDKPCVEVFPLENLRIDPSAHWADPINTSPYLIQLVPMYLGDVKHYMNHADPKGRQWKRYTDEEIRAGDSADDSTRQARNGNRQDPAQERREVSDYDIVWIQRHIHRFDGTDYDFYALNDGKLLTDPDILDKTVFHGRRPYVLGIAHLETHKVMPEPIPTLIKPLQDSINSIENQRTDNVLFVLNKRWKAKRGANVDTTSLVRNVPGGVTMLDNMEDVEAIEWPDVTASSYQESMQKRMSLDELVGNFNPMTMHQAGAPREAQGTVAMLQAPASLMTEYMLHTFAQTFALPVLRQLVLLEQHYETDSKILAIAGQKGQVFQKFGIDQVTDEMLDQEVTTQINVGMGATDPIRKLNRFLASVQTFALIAQTPPPGVSLGEVWKEMMALSGYQDGSRFTTGADPQLVKLEQINKGLTQQIQALMKERKDKEQSNIIKLVTNRETNKTRLDVEKMKQTGANVNSYAQHLMDQSDMLLARALAPPEVPGAQPGARPAANQGAGVSIQ